MTARGQARADASPADVDREFVVLFMIFNENRPGEAKNERGLMHSVSGYVSPTTRGRGCSIATWATTWTRAWSPPSPCARRELAPGALVAAAIGEPYPTLDIDEVTPAP